MYPYLFRAAVPYDEISTNILKNLYNLSGLTLTIEKNNNGLIKDTSINKNSNFQQYVTEFNSGKYFLFQSQGFMQSLVNNKSYSLQNICYWLTNIFYPASYRFNLSLDNFKKLKTDTTAENTELVKLDGILNEFKREIDVIMQQSSLYEAIC